MSGTETTFERHFSVEELSELWGMSDDFVRRLFLREPGVVVFFHHRPGRRTYRTLRIPESVSSTAAFSSGSTPRSRRRHSAGPSTPTVWAVLHSARRDFNRLANHGIGGPVHGAAFRGPYAGCLVDYTHRNGIHVLAGRTGCGWPATKARLATRGELLSRAMPDCLEAFGKPAA